MSPGSSAVRTPRDAICFICNCLNHPGDIAAIHNLKLSIENQGTDWVMLADIANQYLLTPALWAAMNRKNLVQLSPVDFMAYLELIYEMNLQRNRLIREQTIEVARSLNRHGIRPILMKGVLTLFEADCDEGASIMADIDLLITRRELPPAISALRSLGYDLLDDSAVHGHAWTFHRPMSLATIDLHCDVGPQRALLSPVDARAKSEPVNHSSATMSGLAVSHRLLLLVMSFGMFERHYLAGHVPLNGLRDLAGLCERRSWEIDWEYLFRTTSENEMGAPAAAMFHMARQLMNVPVPIYLRRSRAAQRYLDRCFLQLAYPTLGRAGRAYAQIVWPLNRFRMDYRYHCGTRGRSLAAARIRHGFKVLERRNPFARFARHNVSAAFMTRDNLP